MTNVRLSSGSSETRSAGNKDSDDKQRGGLAKTTTSQIVGGSSSSDERQDAMKTKTWQPVSRRANNNSRMMVPVLERAREWIDATPKPSHDDWTGPVFPAREMVRAYSQDKSTQNQPITELSCVVAGKSPAKSSSYDNADFHVGSPSQRVSAAGGPLQGLVVPDDVTKTGVVVGPQPAVAVDAASELVYVIGSHDGRGTQTDASVQPQSRERSLLVHSVTDRPGDTEDITVPSNCSTVNRQLMTAAVCSFANGPRTAQYMTKRVYHLGCLELL